MAVRCVAYQKARDALTKNFNFVDSTRAACCSDASTTQQGCTGKDGYGSRKIHAYLSGAIGNENQCCWCGDQPT